MSIPKRLFYYPDRDPEACVTSDERCPYDNEYEDDEPGIEYVPATRLAALERVVAAVRRISVPYQEGRQELRDALAALDKEAGT